MTMIKCSQCNRDATEFRIDNDSPRTDSDPRCDKHYRPTREEFQEKTFARIVKSQLHRIMKAK